MRSRSPREQGSSDHQQAPQNRPHGPVWVAYAPGVRKGKSLLTVHSARSFGFLFYFWRLEGRASEAGSFPRCSLEIAVTPNGVEKSERIRLVTVARGSAWQAGSAANARVCRRRHIGAPILGPERPRAVALEDLPRRLHRRGGDDSDAASEADAGAPSRFGRRRSDPSRSCGNGRR